MKVNKNSWHYKIVKFYDFNWKPNLCSYIRTFFASIAISIMLLVTAMAVLTIILYGPVLQHFFLVPDEGGQELLVFISALFWYFIGYAVLKIVRDKMKPWSGSWLKGTIWAKDINIFAAGITKYKLHRITTGKADPKPKGPNIFIEYLKVIKNKTCPIIEVVDDDV